jgi:hypothetical protein
MLGNKHWSINATNLYLGTTREHRMAHLRIGPFQADVSYEILHGWKFAVHFRPFHVEVGKAADEQRRREWFEETFERNPSFGRSIKAGQSDFEAGRCYRLNTADEHAPMEPCETWRPDDPVQPEGWHHDGEKWVIDDEGWSRDRGGYWRFTRPTDYGWVMRRNRWEYIDKLVAARGELR